MKFQRLSIVRLCSPKVPPPDSPDDERLQSEHVAYLSGLRDKGIALNGPVVVDSWWLPSVPVTLGDRVDIEV